MKLDRNININGKGKYALINCRKIDQLKRVTVEGVEHFMVPVAAVDFGAAHAPDEFFLIRLKDRFALSALQAYAEAASDWDQEYAGEIFDMAARSGRFSQFCKDPD